MKLSLTGPFLLLIVPCKDRERFLAPCLESFLGNDYSSQLTGCLDRGQIEPG